jgi:hypothetical protein
MALTAFVINLERDAGRLAAINRQFDHLAGFTVKVVPGTFGQSLSDNACNILTRSANWVEFKGTIGCFMSHVKAWEEVSKLSEPFAVVLEDDVDVAALDHLSGLTVPDDAELIFLNERVSPCEPHDGPPRVLAMWHALKLMDLQRSGPGGDGYLLTPAGASRLLNACLTDTYYGHVDGRLLRYATREEDFRELPDDSWIVSVIKNHHHPQLRPTLGLVKGYCLSRPLVRHRGVPSSREAADKPQLNE